LSSSRPDLAAIPFVDNHAHPLTHEQPHTAEELRRHFSEAHAGTLAGEYVDASVPYRWALRQLGAVLGVEPVPEAILARRDELRFQVYARELVAAGNISYVLLDEGYPPPAVSYSSEKMAELTGVPVGRILRLETLLQTLIADHDTLDAVSLAFDGALEAARQSSYVALKSIAAYRSGLAIEPVTEDAAASAFRRVRDQGVRDDAFRLADKTLIDFFVYRALRYASAHALPVQFHTGYGDPDLDLRLANPLHLRPLFEDATLAAAPIVLLHGSYPFTAEAAYLAAVYPNAYLDMSFSLPPLGGDALRQVVQTALAVAPAGKLLTSSDGTCIPEHYWLGATRARECLSEVLGALVERGEVGMEDAVAIAGRLLHENAARLYRLPGEA